MPLHSRLLAAGSVYCAGVFGTICLEELWPEPPVAAVIFYGLTLVLAVVFVLSLESDGT